VRVSWKRPIPATSEQTEKDFVLQTGDKISVRQNGYLQVDVVDSGAGMTKEQLKAVFGEGTYYIV